MNQRRQIVVIGTSTGGLRALKHLAARFPADFPAAVLVVMHVGRRESMLARIVLPYSGLSVRHPGDGEAIQPGKILIAPSDYHMLVEDGRVRLWHGPKENFSRPAIDPLFRSAAFAYRSGVIGVVLTGNLDDGTIGLQAIKAYGGLAIVQDPAEAEAPGMPLSAVEHVDVDYCLPLDRIVDVLVELVEEPGEAGDDAQGSASIKPLPDNRLSFATEPGVDELQKIGAPSVFTCPECHGALWEIDGGCPVRFQCCTGHAYTARTLASAHGQLAEEAIWAAVRALHEKEALLTRFANMEGENARMKAEHLAAAHQAAAHAVMLRKIISG